MGGEQSSEPLKVVRDGGSSPRGRGTELRSVCHARPARFIPAWAGNSGTRHVHGKDQPVHPRVGGEQLPYMGPVAIIAGSSPRGRGTDTLAVLPAGLHRFIPAWAGNSAETATAGATSSGNIATVVSPHIAIGDKKTRKKYGLTGGLPNPPKAKAQTPKDNALDMKGTSIFGGPLKR